jgi:hypothetical protein
VLRDDIVVEVLHHRLTTRRSTLLLSIDFDSFLARPITLLITTFKTR